MNKRLFVVLGAVALLVGGIFWCTMKRQKESVVTSVVQQGEIGTVSADYKTVRVSDGQISFTFEVPQDWTTETRNMGEKPMIESELREFLATAYQGKDPKNPTKQVSDYAHLAWSDLEKMSLSDMRQFMADREKSVGPYPNASVSGNNHIWYTDWNGSQIDFYLLPTKDTVTAIESEKADELKELKQYPAEIAEMLKTKWTNTVVGGKEAVVANYQLEVLENGERVEGGFKGRPAGKKYYIVIPDLKKTLVIDKQSFVPEGDFEKNFDRLVQTIKF